MVLPITSYGGMGDAYIYKEGCLRTAIEAVSAIKHCTSLYNA